MDLITGTAGGAFDATFVTLLDNQASETTGGADLHLSAAAGVELPIVLRGVLLGGVGEGSDGPSCAGTRFATTPVPGLTWDTSFVTDASCDGAAGSVITAPTFTTVPFLTGTTALPVPEDGAVTIGQVACGDGWPSTDQRGTSRPQGTACDAGAVERVATAPPPPPPPSQSSSDPGPAPEPAPEPVDTSAAGPVPTAVPAGDGGCADVRAPFSGRRAAPAPPC
jgi:adhesin HecA-like repeat protein